MRQFATTWADGSFPHSENDTGRCESYDIPGVIPDPAPPEDGPWVLSNTSAVLSGGHGFVLFWTWMRPDTSNEKAATEPGPGWLPIRNDAGELIGWDPPKDGP